MDSYTAWPSGAASVIMGPGGPMKRTLVLLIVLIASLMLYRETGNDRFWEWFSQTLDYCKKVFSDPAYGEWYGYLRRDGAPTEPPCKGSTFKGPFHLPRALAMADTMLNALLQD